MPGERTAASIENGEEARAFLQDRVALFWKVLFFLMLFASTLGAVGALNRKPGGDLAIDIIVAAEAGVFWWISKTGRRSVRFLRTLEAVGLLLYFSSSTFIGRYVLVGFVHERSLTTSDAILMADAYLSILGIFGSALMILVRAALIPSSPRRTVLYTAMIGVPSVLTPTLFVPAAAGGFAWRGLDSPAFPWFPAALVMVWCFVVVTSTVISRVIYGLRAAVRDARRLGQYVLEEKIGEGGMGEVYRARHGMMRRPSALKLLRAGQAEQRHLVRFEREVQLTARLTHPNTITIFDYGRTDDGVFYYAMELLDGATLQRVVEVSGPQAQARVLRILTMICGALVEAHSIGLIHRDIKPANIMLCTQGGEADVVKLLDFGLVKELAVTGDAALSVAATLVGTPQYMAPESILSPDSVDARADLYAVGAVAYFLLAGDVVFSGRTIVEVCYQHLHQEPMTMADRGIIVSSELERIVLSCLAKRPEDRPQSAAELKRSLEACAAREVWDADQAQQWWREHQRALQSDGPHSLGSHRTIGVDARSRSALRAVG